MKTELIEGKDGYKAFDKVCENIYEGNKHYRNTEASIESMLILGPTHFHTHAKVKMFLIRDTNDYAGRFALIHDEKLSNYVQVAFFESQPDLGDVLSLIKNEIKIHFSECSKIVIGLNGHLNYGAGFLLNRFDEPPLFGLPYTQPYYPKYFAELNEMKMYSFRFPLEKYFAWADTYKVKSQMDGLSIRFMDKKQIKEETKIYTYLNNKAFTKHPFWSDRAYQEDIELFYPFRFLLKNENLILAFHNDKPVGFYLWYPDFNQLVKTRRELNILDVIRFKLGTNIDTFRFTEIGILPEYQRKPVALSLMNASLPALRKAGFKYCEGGFIFEKNKASILLAKRTIERVFKSKAEPYRHYAVYEGDL